MATVETIIGWFWALCIFSVVIVFIVALIVIALSPALAILYFLACWYDEKTNKNPKSH